MSASRSSSATTTSAASRIGQRHSCAPRLRRTARARPTSPSTRRPPTFGAAASAIDDLLSQRRLGRVKDGARTLILRAELEAYLRRGADDPSTVAPLGFGCLIVGRFLVMEEARLGQVVRDQVDVGRQREGGRVVTEHDLHLLGVPARAKEDRRAGVAQRVDAGPRDARPRRGGLHDRRSSDSAAQGRAGAAGKTGASSGGCRALGGARAPAPGRRDRHVADAVAALGDVEACPCRCAAARSRGGPEVDVLPSQGDQLADPQPGLGEEADEEAPALGRLLDDAGELLLGRGRAACVRRLLARRPAAGQADAGAGVAADEALLGGRREAAPAPARSRRARSPARGPRSERWRASDFRSRCSISASRRRPMTGMDVLLQVALVLARPSRADTPAGAALRRSAPTRGRSRRGGRGGLAELAAGDVGHDRAPQQPRLGDRRRRAPALPPEGSRKATT